jgi:hypothetical protein
MGGPLVTTEASPDLDVGPAATRLRFFRFAEYVLVYAATASVGWIVLYTVLLSGSAEARSTLGTGFGAAALIFGIAASVAALVLGAKIYLAAGKLRPEPIRRYSRLLPIFGFVLLAVGVLFIMQGASVMERARKLELSGSLITIQGINLWTGEYQKTPEMEAQFAELQSNAAALRGYAMPLILQGDIAFLAGLVGFLGLWGLWRFKRVKLAPAATPMTYLDEIDRARQAQIPPKSGGKPISRTRGILFLLIAAAMLTLPYFIVGGDYGSAFGLIISGVLGIVVSFVAFYALFRAKQYFQVSADSLLAADRRKPILFLRSFSDDPKVEAAAGISHQGLAQLIDFSVETRLANHFMAFGPFVAVGAPKDKVPQIGAARKRLSDDEWQQAVAKWMEQSSAIVMYAGTTHWIGWELARIIEGGYATKLILLFPPVLPFPGSFQKKWLARQKPDILKRFESVKTAFAGTRWDAALNGIAEPETVLCMRFLPDGTIETLRSKRRSKDAYELCAEIAHLHLLEAQKTAIA